MSLRSNVRDLKLNKQPIYVLEAELFEISQQNKLNKKRAQINKHT